MVLDLLMSNDYIATTSIENKINQRNFDVEQVKLKDID